jgi:hypothetical protein
MFALTLDLEPDHAGLLPEYFGLCENRETIKEFLDFLKQQKVPLTVFVTGKCIEKRPAALPLFEDYGCEFHSHGYAHRARRPDHPEDIAKGKEVFERYFGYPPQGYRAPEGKITEQGIEKLKELGFTFDSSIFPSFWPNPFKYLRLPYSPHHIDGTKILELPFSIINPLKLTFSLSYVKLLGFGFYRFFFNHFRQPDVIVFDSHLHDLFPSRKHNRLPLFWRMVYNRNKTRGFLLLKKTLALIKNKGYSFVSMKTLLQTVPESKTEIRRKETGHPGETEDKDT